MLIWLIIEVVLWFAFVSLCVSHDKGVAAFFVTVGVTIALYFTGINVYAYAWNNPLDVATGAVLWMVLGFLTSTLLFIRMLRKSSKLYAKDKKAFLEGTFLSHVEDRTEQGFIAYVKDQWGLKEKYAPTVSRNKSKIMFWAIWWPFAIVSHFFSNFIIGFFDKTWKFLKAWLENIRCKVLGEAAKDLD